MTTVLALDISSRRTGYALFEDGKLVSYGSWKLDKDPIEKRAYFLSLMVKNLPSLEISIPDITYYDVLVMEDAYLDVKKSKMNPNTFKKLCRMQGAAMAAASPSMTEIVFITPSQWRSCFLGKGKGGGKRSVIKQKVKKQVEIEFGIKVNNDDESDAIGIGFGWIQMQKFMKITEQGGRR